MFTSRALRTAGSVENPSASPISGDAGGATNVGWDIEGCTAPPPLGGPIPPITQMNSAAEDKGTLSKLDRSQDRRSPCASQLPVGAKRARPFPHWVVIFTAAVPRQARGSWGGSQDSLKSRYLTAKHGCDASQRGISVQRSPLSQCWSRVVAVPRGPIAKAGSLYKVSTTVAPGSGTTESASMSLTSLLPPGLSLLQGIELFIQLVGDTTVVNRAAGERAVVVKLTLISVLKHFVAAASTWVAYDICLTFGQEVRCFNILRMRREKLTWIIGPGRIGLEASLSLGVR